MRRSRRASCSTSSRRLKKRRAGLAPRRRRCRRRPRPRRAHSLAVPAAAESWLRQATARRRAAARARTPAVAKKTRRRRFGERQAPVAGGARRAARRLARAACAVWHMPSRRWRSLLYKLAIGLGIAGSPSPIRTSCRISRAAAPTSSRARRPTSRRPRASPATRGAVTGARHRRPGALDRVGRRRRHAARCGTRAPARWCARSSSTTGRPTALAVDERRALTGHKGGADRPVGPGARREARHLPAPAGARSPHWLSPATPNHFAVAGQAGAVALFDIRTPSAPAAVFDGQDGAQAIASVRAVGAVGGGRPGPQHPAVADRHAQPRAQPGAGRRYTERARHGAGRPHASPAAARAARCVFGPTSSSRPQRSFKAHEGRVTARRVCAQRPPARLRRRGRSGQAVGPARRRHAARIPRPRRTRALRCLLPRRPPRHLRRPGRHHPRLEHCRRHGPGAGVTRRRTLRSISWLASRLKRRSRGSRPNDIASVSGLVPTRPPQPSTGVRWAFYCSKEKTGPISGRPLSSRRLRWGGCALLGNRLRTTNGGRVCRPLRTGAPRALSRMRRSSDGRRCGNDDGELRRCDLRNAGGRICWKIDFVGR